MQKKQRDTRCEHGLKLTQILSSLKLYHDQLLILMNIAQAIHPSDHKEESSTTLHFLPPNVS